ncbi:2,3-dihydro-2,3-dihydroxybenzoate dehydrogenase [Micromonospora sp. WMMD1076]|uniref:2,3-dihydro-2,3-dihydroxybenzoate dehydrogenase n=1 Tax=Micromonospora TaxID=1873 RepID=UPI00249CAA1F|nr:2,3-dihydro-2,3-dihydroxybenzoate dehydrogenase [Micromonospora sp. WMMD1076]WFF04669.1 2,3-dihydro-2,3-dihydroxybenzoate dehydrogenase [Micromonospora sp. WMMD1076]
MTPDGISGRTALVTGAARGIGAAVASALASRGALVALTDVDGLAAHRLAATLAGARAYPLDVTDNADVERVFTAAEADLGPVEICVSVAGILRPARVLDTTDADWRATFDVNTTGVFHVLRCAGRRMAGRGRGSIVTVSSNAAGIPRVGMAAYAAAKAATTMLTKCLGLELAERGVRCNVVAPGSTDTAMQRALWTGPDAAAGVIAGSLADHRTGIPLGRLADPADIADAVLFLASDQARHITMHDLYVDGGATLRA